MAVNYGDTLFGYMVRTVGHGRARKVMSYMSSWAIVEDDIGEEPSIEAFSAWWKQSAAKTYREQAAFRECFPGERSPSRLNQLGAERLKRSKPRKLGDIAIFGALKESDLRSPD